MKKLFLIAALGLSSVILFAQDELTKSGWNFGALPTITFDSDLGFQYGGLVNLFNYGDGSRYPTYDHMFYFEVSRFTKGSGINRIAYDSDKLIDGIQTFADMSYLTDQAYDFYGFNGFDAVVNRDWLDKTMPEDVYRTRMFYKYDRKLFRFKVDLIGNLSGEKIKWITGVNMLNFKISQVDVDRLNKGKEEDLLPSNEEQPGLYQKYQDWGIISAKDANGGFVPTFKAGIVYDTRDNKPNPMKGMWTEAVLVGSPEFLGGEQNFVKLSLTHRQYFTIVPRDLSFAYRLAYQTTLAGHAPFYYQTQMITSFLRSATSEGLGGSHSLRGVWRNRVIGDGFFLGNVEARWKFTHFQFINNNFYLALNVFGDFGRVTNKIDIELKAPDYGSSTSSDYFEQDAEKMHFSYGAGFRVVMNENFIVKCDYGRAADPRDGDSGIYIGLGYLF